MEYVYGSSWASKLQANDQVVNPNQTLHRTLSIMLWMLILYFCLHGERNKFYGLFYSFTFASILKSILLYETEQF